MKMQDVGHRTSKIVHRALRRWKLSVFCSAAGAWMLLGCITAVAQSTNSPSVPNTADSSDYNSYRIITERNIFNQNRTGHYVRSQRQTTRRQSAPVKESFSLVGTMSYPKGSFAFFDGTRSDYKKVLEPGATIAGYKVKEITAQNVTLVGTNEVAFKMDIGTQMRREENGWQLPQQSESQAVTTSERAESVATPTGSDANSGMEMNDVLKKLMQQREQEDSK